MEPLLAALAFSAGIISVLSPCCIAMLPTFISYYLGRAEQRASTAVGLGRALLFGSASTLGFLSVFTTFGFILSQALAGVTRFLFHISVLVGLALAALGVVMFLGFSFPINVPVKAPLERGGVSFFLYGVGYGIVSLGCTLPIFLMLVVYAASFGGFSDGIITFILYSLGHGTVMIFLSLLVGTAKQVTSTHLKTIMPHVRDASSLLVIVMGVYVVMYQLYSYGQAFRKI